jgi:hypothetical protein
VFCQSEFGIKAGFPIFSRQFIQPRNAGIMTAATQRRPMFSAL